MRKFSLPESLFKSTKAFSSFSVGREDTIAPLYNLSNEIAIGIDVRCPFLLDDPSGRRVEQRKDFVDMPVYFIAFLFKQRSSCVAVDATLAQT